VAPGGDGGGGFEVRPADLSAHANAIDAVAGSLGMAGQAGGQVRLDAGAYGKLCQILPTLLGFLQDRVIDGIDAAQVSVADTAGRVRQVAQAYQGSDAASAARLAPGGGR
jgi:hypothetical protein